MTKISALAIGAALAFSTVALAHADPILSGAWKLSIGENDVPCTLMLAADGAAEKPRFDTLGKFMAQLHSFNS